MPNAALWAFENVAEAALFALFCIIEAVEKNNRGTGLLSAIRVCLEQLLLHFEGA
jgi:hypothetical protein